MSTAEETFGPAFRKWQAERAPLEELWRNRLAPHREAVLGLLRGVGQPFDEEGVWAKLVAIACNRRGAPGKCPWQVPWQAVEQGRILDVTADLRALLDALPVTPWPEAGKLFGGAVEDTIKALDCLRQEVAAALASRGPAKRGPKGPRLRLANNEILALARVYTEATGKDATTTGRFITFLERLYSAMGKAVGRATLVKAAKKALPVLRSVPIEAEDDDEED